MWLGFFDGAAETSRGACWSLGPDGGSPALGIRYVSVEVEAAAHNSHLLAVVHKLLTLWLEETTWRSLLDRCGLSEQTTWRFLLDRG